MTIEFQLFVFANIGWIIFSIKLFFMPSHIDFIVVCLLTAVLPTWLNKQILTTSIMHLFLPIIFSIIILVPAIISISKNYPTYYSDYELLIFLSISYYFISQTIFNINVLEIYGEKIGKAFNKNTIRFVILLLTNIATFTNNNFQMINCVSSAIILSLSFDTLYKDIEKKERRRFNDTFVISFQDYHEKAVIEAAEFGIDYITLMEQRYSKIKIIDIYEIDDCIAKYVTNEYKDYIPSIGFISCCTFGSIKKAIERSI